MGRLSKRVINRIKITITKKRQTMKKKLFKTRLLSFAAFCGLAIAFASCANEDVAQGTTGTETDNDKNLTTFVAGDEAKTRTSMDYTTGNFYWEAGDYIYVKDDDGTWQKSNNAPTSKVASFKFKVPGKFKNSTTYKVYYPGKNGNQDQVTIPATQAQATPNATDHFGVSGDCGTADASKQSNGSFAFALDHQAAILVFQPYTTNALLNNCRITKVEVYSDNEITGSYTLNPTSGELTGTGSGKHAILNTKGTGSYADGFPLTSTSSVTTNGAYMLINPGTHKLIIRYWIKDLTTNIEGASTKFLSAFNYDKNTFYDMTADLVKDYSGNGYYTWDAAVGEHFWKGHEWNNPNPSLRTQATVSGQSFNASDVPALAPESPSNPGGYRADTGTPPFPAANRSAKDCPNVNEMIWYVLKGDGHWDNTELWTTMGHLYHGGVWLKKQSVIAAEQSPSINVSDMKLAAPDGTDYRIVAPATPGLFLSRSPLAGFPTTQADNYFYMPARGYYRLSPERAEGIGTESGYWCSTPYPTISLNAYSFLFMDNLIGASSSNRFIGVPLWKAE